jgi:hypothetical protein
LSDADMFDTWLGIPAANAPAMSFKTIDSSVLDTISGGATMRQQITDRLNTEATHRDVGSPTGLSVHCGPNKSGTVMCNGSYKTWLGNGGGTENDAYKAVFQKGTLQHLQTRMTGGD